MNIKQFYTIKALYVLPPELIHKIWKNVMDSCADTISRQYWRKIDNNSNFLHFMINSNDYTSGQLNFILKTYKNLISYKYISNPSCWYYVINDLMQGFLHLDYYHSRRRLVKSGIDYNTLIFVNCKIKELL